MSLKQEIETWVEALAQYDNNEFEESLSTFDGISDTSKILFNCGVIHATLGEHDKAVECYQRAVRLDQYLAVAYFQQGVSNFLVGDFEEALANFNDTLLYLRGNTYIDYEQLGLKFKLFSCEVLFNRGLCYIYLRQKEAGMADLSYAAKEKVTPDHEVIDDAIREHAEVSQLTPSPTPTPTNLPSQGYTVFSIPVGVVYRPNSAKVKNLKTKDYLGKARLIASVNPSNSTTGFAGPEIKRNQSIREARPLDQVSFAASNLVRADLVSRARQQSEPPINRNLFPPTPPPESEQHPHRPLMPPSTRTSPASTNSTLITPTLTARANSVRNSPSRLVTAAAERRISEDLSPKSSSAPQHEKPRIGTSRTASEPRGPTSSKYAAPSRSTGRGRLFMETIPHDGEGESDEYPDELYDLYRNTAYSNPYTSPPAPQHQHPQHQHPQHQQQQQQQQQQRRPSSRHRPEAPRRKSSQYPDDPVGGDVSPSTTTHSSLDDFEILNDAGGTLSRPREMSRSRGTSRSRTRRQVDVRTLRVKVHWQGDTRYLMVSTGLIFEEFVARVREKLGLRAAFKVRIRDEGDLITMGDRDDWEMAVMGARREARGREEEMGKLEVWVQDLPLST
ncbi:hypothetical protein MMC32_000507 [Xylographa parallela]|nr:hypothetical protein [Xylographa parallela]